ncbi:hypothetical protein SDC9_112847 [bioreactor metagenome]|uniref:Uncharacterized protein n=1 Tax=bioreactor metagenome TaxID=1076179 RepID=A0A645BRT9_9ZZZZ
MHQLCVPDFQIVEIATTAFTHFFQGFVALHEHFVVSDHIVEISLVELRNNRIEKSASYFCGIVYQVYITRGDHNNRKSTDVFRKPLIFLIVAFYFFFSSRFDGDRNFFSNA